MGRLSTENFQVTLDHKNGRRILGPFTLYILSELAFSRSKTREPHV